MFSSKINFPTALCVFKKSMASSIAEGPSYVCIGSSPGLWYIFSRKCFRDSFNLDTNDKGLVLSSLWRLYISVANSS